MIGSCTWNGHTFCKFEYVITFSDHVSWINSIVWYIFGQVLPYCRKLLIHFSWYSLLVSNLCSMNHAFLSWGAFKSFVKYTFQTLPSVAKVVFIFLNLSSVIVKSELPQRVVNFIPHLLEHLFCLLYLIVYPWFSSCAWPLLWHMEESFLQLLLFWQVRVCLLGQ